MTQKIAKNAELKGKSKKKRMMVGYQEERRAKGGKGRSGTEKILSIVHLGISNQICV